MNRILTSLTLCTFASCLFAEAAPPAVNHANEHANLGAGQGERREKCLVDLKTKNPEAFKKIDRDGDGEISGAEFGSFLEHREDNFKETHPDLFAAIDANGDGKIDKDEMKAARETRQAHFEANHPKAFEHADKNDDGKIGPKEAAHAREEHRERQEKKAGDK